MEELPYPEENSRFAYLMWMLRRLARVTPASEAHTGTVLRESAQALADLAEAHGFRGQTVENYAEAFNKRQIGVHRGEFYQRVFAAVSGEPERLRELIIAAPVFGTKDEDQERLDQLDEVLGELAATKPSYLLTFNPSGTLHQYDFDLDDWAEIVEQVHRTGTRDERWSTGPRRTLPTGSRVFILRQGTGPAGVVGVGHTRSTVAEDEDGVHRVDAVITHALLDAPPLLARSHLLEEFPDQDWKPQGSGNWVPRPVADILEARLTGQVTPREDAEASSEAVLDRLLDIARPLVQFRNLVLEGVPGTGKTYAFQQLVQHWEQVRARVDPDGTHRRMLPLPPSGGTEAITFHPATTYEDFVEGIRPRRSSTEAPPAVRMDTDPDDPDWFWRVDTDAADGWGVMDGLLLRLCRRAAADPSHTHVLLVDEINRANVPKVLGDLLTTLERSKRARWTSGGWRVRPGGWVRLPVSQRRFFVPDNLLFLATMNTSDRSVASLDLALRRRFGFHRLEPLELGGPLLDALSQVLGVDGGPAEPMDIAADPLWAATLAGWRDLNTVLARRLGPDAELGHSYIFDLATDLRHAGLQLVTDRGNDTRTRFFKGFWRQTLAAQVLSALQAAGEAELLLPDGPRTPAPSGDGQALARAFECFGMEVFRSGGGFLAGPALTADGTPGGDITSALQPGAPAVTGEE